MAAHSGGRTFLIGIILIITTSSVSGTAYTYLGCFLDSATYPDLSGSSQTITNLTVDACVTTCRNQGYPYAGLQEGTKCMCGDTYNQRGPSTSCTTCTLPNRCGGVLSNDVYYTEDPGVTGRRPVAHSDSNSFVMARRVCIQSGGDLIVPNSQAVVDSLVQLWAATDVVSVWIGLRRRTNTSVVYEWTDATVQPAYQSSSFSSFWTAGDAQVENCVSLVLGTGKWKSLPCDTALPYTCNQPGLDGSSDDTSSDKSSDSSNKNNKRLALFIVLPIFLFCYGGSCILYCVHKIIKNCTKKPPAKVPLDQMENGNRYMDHPFRPPPKRSLSASKGRVHPMAPPVGVGLDIPTKPMPSYIPQTGQMGGLGGKAPTDYKPGFDPNQRPSSSSGVHLSMNGANLLAPPPPYSDEKRAQLLENAARESRERRAKEEAEGRPVSSPFAGPKRVQEGDESPRDQISPRSTGSTTNLLGNKGGHDDDDDDMGTSRNNTPLSINEILKRKVQEKKPKKIVTT